MLKIDVKSFEQTEQVGQSLGKLLKSKEVICISGDLGTGKTTFVKGLARGMGIKEHLTSPTFTIINEYESAITLYHFDVYRINDSEELFEIGFEEYIDGDGVCVIEWAELIKEVLPEEKLWIKIKKNIDKGNDFREIVIEAFGTRYEILIQQLSAKWSEYNENTCN